MIATGLPRKRLSVVRGFIGELYGHDLHARRVAALAGATLGVMTGSSLAVATIGQALAQARGLVTKHAIKQVDRLMSNAGIDVWDSFTRGSRIRLVCGGAFWSQWTGPTSTTTANRPWC